MFYLIIVLFLDELEILIVCVWIVDIYLKSKYIFDLLPLFLLFVFILCIIDFKSS